MTDIIKQRSIQLRREKVARILETSPGVPAPVRLLHSPGEFKFVGVLTSKCGVDCTENFANSDEEMNCMDCRDKIERRNRPPRQRPRRPATPNLGDFESRLASGEFNLQEGGIPNLEPQLPDWRM